MVCQWFEWQLSPQVSWTLLSILSDLNNAVDWIGSTRPSNPVPVPILLLLYQEYKLQLVLPSFSCSTFFMFSCKVSVLIFLFAYFQFYSLVCSDSTVRHLARSLFFSRSGLLTVFTWSVCILILLISLTRWQFFTSVLSGSLSLEPAWQKVSWSLQDSSHDSRRSKQGCSLDGLHWYSNFKVIHPL